jgi:DNA-binding protein YbaB
MAVCRLTLLALFACTASGFTHPRQASAWTTAQQRRPHAGGPRMLFGGAEEAPVPEKAASKPAPAAAGGGMGGMTEDQIQEEMKLAMEYREKMQEKLRAMECKGESNGVTAVFNGEQQPVKITVSDEAMKAGRAVVQDAVVEAINQAMQESQKAMQTTMMDMQKELMSTLQAQQKK